MESGPGDLGRIRLGYRLTVEAVFTAMTQTWTRRVGRRCLGIEPLQLMRSRFGDPRLTSLMVEHGLAVATPMAENTAVVGRIVMSFAGNA